MGKTVVFHVVSRFDVGGAERVAMNIASSRTEEFCYHVVEVIRGRTDYSATCMYEMRERGIAFHRSPVPAFPFHYVFERLAAAVFPLWFIFLWLKYRPQVIHSHTEVPDMAVTAFLSLFPWLRRRVRVVRTIHNTRLWTGLGRTGRAVERFMQRHGVNVAISPAVRDCYVRSYGGDPVVIYNGVPSVTQGSFPGIVPACRNVLFAGRMEAQKGVATLIQIVRSMEDDARYHFHIIGDGTLRPDVEQALGGLGNVTLHKPVYGLGAYLSNFNLLLMPSEFEGLSILAIEASLASLPVVCNSCPGLIDTLPPDWPLAVSGNCLDEYLHLFRDVIPTADLARLGSEAHRYALSRFSVRQMQEGYESVYRK